MRYRGSASKRGVHLWRCAALVLVLIMASITTSCTDQPRGRIIGTVHTILPINCAIVRLANADFDDASMASNLYVTTGAPPVADVQAAGRLAVRRLDDSAAVFAEARTDADGVFEFSGLPSGRYYLVVLIPPDSLGCSHDLPFTTVDGWTWATERTADGLVALVSYPETLARGTVARRVQSLTSPDEIRWDVDLNCLASEEQDRAMLRQACEDGNQAACKILSGELKVPSALARDEALARDILRRFCEEGDQSACKTFRGEDKVPIIAAAGAAVLMHQACKRGDRAACAAIYGKSK